MQTNHPSIRKVNHRCFLRLPLHVIKGSGVNLLGRNWMALMRLNWEEEHNKRT